MASLVGGDIAGLYALRDRLTGIPGDIVDSSDFLSGRVSSLADDAGWSGDAADNFKAAWDRDAAAATALASAFNQVGGIVGTLSDTLNELERELEAAEAGARRAGAALNPDGTPFTGPIPISVANATSAYAQTYVQLKARAQQARKQALAGLAVVCDRVAPPGSGGGPTRLSGADDVMLTDVLRSLWATPVAHREVINARLDQLRDQRSWLNHVKSTPSEFDEAMRAAARAEKRALAPKLRDLQTKLAGVEGGIEGKLPLTGVASYTAGDAIGAAPEGRIGKVLAGVPILGIAAAGVATYLQAKDDHEKGWSWGHAIVADGVPNAAGLVAGTAAEVGLGVALVGAPEGVAAGAVVLGGIAVGYGVGAFGVELTHAHWSDNIHRDGVVKGIGDSIAEAGKATWNNDVVGFGSRIGSSAKGVWKSVVG
jgi:uncharacterized protein YukE